MDKARMYIFERKARFYEKHHQRKADRLIVISPMTDERAKKVARNLNIEIYVVLYLSRKYSGCALGRI